MKTVKLKSVMTMLACVAVTTAWSAVVPRAWSEEEKELQIIVVKPDAGGENAKPQSDADAEKKTKERLKALQEKMQQLMEAARKKRQKEMDERAKDPQWKPSHAEVAVIRIGDHGKPVMLNNFCLSRDGNVLACCGGTRTEYVRTETSAATTGATPPRAFTVKTISEPNEIRVFSPTGKLLKTWKLKTKPEAIAVLDDGTIFVGGDGRLLKLDADGKLIKSARSPAVAAFNAEQKKQQAAAKAKTDEKPQKKEAGNAVTGAQTAAAAAMAKARVAAMARRIKTITGIAVTDRDVFVTCPESKGFGYAVWRMDHDFKHRKQIVTGLRGCCGQMDVQARDGEVWIPENARHQVARYDRDGNILAKFGRADRKAADGFGGCCEPKNLCFGLDGDVYTAESGPPVAVKHFATDGKFLGVVALPTYKIGCVRVSVEVSQDGKRVYTLDTGSGAIHVFEGKGA